MEFTLESALSPGGMVGHASYFLLILSMMMRDMTLLRIVAIASGLVSLAFDVVWLHNPVGAFWDVALVLVNLGQLAISVYLAHRAAFSDEEKAFLAKFMSGLDRGQARRLLNQGTWHLGEPGDTLTREGEQVQKLIYLESGEAEIFNGDHLVAYCHAPCFVGELTCLSGEPATGTAILSQPSRYLAIDATALRVLVRRHDDIRAAVEQAFTKNMRDKLVSANRRHAARAADLMAVGS